MAQSFYHNGNLVFFFLNQHCSYSKLSLQAIRLTISVKSKAGRKKQNQKKLPSWVSWAKLKLALLQEVFHLLPSVHKPQSQHRFAKKIYSVAPLLLNSQSKCNALRWNTQPNLNKVTSTTGFRFPKHQFKNTSEPWEEKYRVDLWINVPVKQKYIKQTCRWI